MVLIPEERLLQYEQQQKGLTNAQDKREHGVPNEQGEERMELSDDVIVRGIPKTMKTRAIALLERLKARPDTISWDDMGQVKIDGTLIPKSNISDLISCAMRSRKRFKPVASREFFDVLSTLNVPKDLVRNEEGLKEVTQKGEGDDWAGLWADVKSGVAVREMKRLMTPFARDLNKLTNRSVGRLTTYAPKGKRKDVEILKDMVKKGVVLAKDPETSRELRRLKRFNPFARRQRGKGGLISPGAWYQVGETSQKGSGKRSQEGGFAFGPYTQGLSGIEKKRRAPQKLRKIPNWEHYKG